MSRLSKADKKDKKGIFGLRKDDKKRPEKTLAHTKSPSESSVSSVNEFIPDPNAVKAFGTPLETLMAYERRKWPGKDIPLLVDKCITYLTTKGLDAEGLFRVPGADNAMRMLGEYFDAGRGDLVNFDKGEPMLVDAADVASLLKKYLRDLPDSLFMAKNEANFNSIMNFGTLEQRKAAYLALVVQLPAVNQAVIKRLLFYLTQVSINAEMNLMDSKNLATVFGVMAGIFANNSGELVQWLIENYFSLYEKEDLKHATTEPVFQRKMVGHVKSVLGLVRQGDHHVWSSDSSGFMQIRDARTFQLVRRFSMGERPNCLPIVFDERLWCCFGTELRVWALSHLLDSSVANPEKDFSRVSFDGYLASICTRGTEVWVGGEQLVVLTKDMWKKELTQKDPRNVITAMAVVDDEVWVIKGKALQAWDATSYTLKRELNDAVNQVSNIAVIGDDVWLPGSAGADGAIWVVDKASLTLTHTLKRHKGTVYHVAQIGSLVWSASWDRSVCTWDVHTKQFVRTIDNPHSDAISWIEPIYRELMGGWQVWTGSYDKTINILFVPETYADNVTSTVTDSASSKSLRLGIRRNEASTSLTTSTNSSLTDLPVSAAVPPYKLVPPPRPPPRAPSDGSFSSATAVRSLPPSRPPPQPAYPPMTFTAVHPTNQDSGQGHLLGAARRTPSAPVTATVSATTSPTLSPRRAESVDHFSYNVLSPSAQPPSPLPPRLSSSGLPRLPEVDWEVERAAASVDYAQANFFVQVLYDYSARSEHEASITTGELFHVFELDPEGLWYHGRGGSPVTLGWFPSNFVAPLDHV